MDVSQHMLGRTYPLRGGLRVRLRLAQARDLRAITALLRAAGAELDELEAARLVRFEPRRRVVVCATALVAGMVRLVGVGAIDVGAEAPDTLCVDPALGDEPRDELGELLALALRDRAAAILARSAA